jgi:hypothetical protein
MAGDGAARRGDTEGACRNDMLLLAPLTYTAAPILRGAGHIGFCGLASGGDGQQPGRQRQQQQKRAGAYRGDGVAGGSWRDWRWDGQACRGGPRVDVTVGTFQPAVSRRQAWKHAAVVAEVWQEANKPPCSSMANIVSFIACGAIAGQWAAPGTPASARRGGTPPACRLGRVAALHRWLNDKPGKPVPGWWGCAS